MVSSRKIVALADNPARAHETGGFVMDLLELLLTRRSIRQYTGQSLSQEDLETILDAGLLAPSSRSRRPWELVVVRDPAMLERLSHCRQGSANMLAGAAAAILVFADQTKSDVWTEDCALVMGNLHLMAHRLGMGSCWIQGRLRQAEDGQESTDAYCRRLLNVPEPYTLEAILSLGHPAVQPPAYTPEEIHREKIHWDSF